MADVQLLQMRVELGLELRAVIRLNDENPKRQPAADIVNEPNRGALIARVKNLQYADARAVVDRGELVQPTAGAWEALEEFDVDLNAMARPRLLVPLPPARMGPMFLIRRQAIETVPDQDTMDR